MTSAAFSNQALPAPCPLPVRQAGQPGALVWFIASLAVPVVDLVDRHASIPEP